MCMMPTSTNSHDSDRQPSSMSVALGRFDRPEAGLAGASTSWLTAMTRVPRGLSAARRGASVTTLPLSHRNSIERDHYSTSTLATLGRLLALAGPWSAMGLALYNCEVEGREEHAGAPKAHPPWCARTAAKQRRISSTTGEACAFDGRIAKKSLRVSSRPAAPSEAGAMLSAHN